MRDDLIKGHGQGTAHCIIVFRFLNLSFVSVFSIAALQIAFESPRYIESLVINVKIESNA